MSLLGDSHSGECPGVVFVWREAPDVSELCSHQRFELALGSR